ncbi:MAG: cytochrome C [Geobacter sp.]|nr:MAG: cytochrome C [Geobacter sp.]
MVRIEVIMVLAVGLVACSGGMDRGESGLSGEELFLRHCSGCHPEGGNSKYPRKSLDRFTLAANGIHTADDIVDVMRHPDQGMTRFDRRTIGDADARKIAGYVLTAFK